MKYWVITDNNELHVIGASFRPKNALPALINPLTNEPEEAVWIHIDNVTDPDTGAITKAVIVNQAVKASILAQRKADKDQDKIDRVEEEARLKSIKDDIKGLNIDQVSGLNDIKVVLEKVKKILVELEKSV